MNQLKRFLPTSQSQSSNNPFDVIDDQSQDQSNQDFEVPGASLHNAIRAVAKCGLIIVGPLTATVTARLIVQLLPIYGVLVTIGVIGLLGSLAFSKNPENKAFALIVGSLVAGGILLGSWDWLAFIFMDSSGASLIYQAGIVVGFAILIAALQRTLRSAGYTPPWEGGGYQQ